MDLTFVPVPSPHIADYIVIAVFLCICMGIGVYYGYQTNKTPTLDNYFLGNRRLLLLPVAMSLFVTFASAISLMGTPAEIYVYGIRGVYIGIGYTFSVMIASITVVPLLYPLRLTSTYEYLQLRFRSKGVRTLGTMIGMLQTVAYMGVTLYAPGLALQTVAGIPLWLSIVVIGLVGTIYTAIGGIKSVVWTDAFQFVMIFTGLAAVTIKGSILMGTRYSVVGIATEGKRLEIFNFDLDPRTRHTIWGTCIGVTFTMLPNWCNQSSIQRVSSLRSVRAAKIVFWLLGPMAIVYFVFLGYLGILLYSYYNALECDPVQAGFLSNFNQLMPYFVLDVMRSLPGLSGIYISCLFSGALSTLSSGINALAANTVEDILGDCVKKSKIVSQTFAAKIFVFSYGLVVIGLAYAINSMSGSITQMALSVFGACGGPLAGLFFLGGMIPKANWIGAMVGSLTALAFNMWITVGSQMYGAKPVKLTQNPTSGCFPNNLVVTMNDTSMYSYNSTMNTTPFGDAGHSSMSSNGVIAPDEAFFLYNVSYVWYGLIGFCLTLIIGIVVSWLTGGDRGEPVEARLIFPICRKICCLKSKYVYEVAEINEKNMHPITFEAKGPPIYFQPYDDEGTSTF
ncbi:sodium-coupled monocarboxylate transporter 2-like [Mizuhopecten yessoensis]|uniref:Sodium-coupled monocarboxylate transporter 2 n=1 Tax=Mizuhopecten yessoensis TaxID=6573 RepID=A0A210PKU8_MIZYE|nr:sodium-coupled monocarboxylate transporter 2-like [Mizuhopecten yessoensis]OWF37094.1 Sodium-coupled monocarboxylate transporter 2 [Mizuhopecten yessoensis]